ncbi:MFS transporter [Myxococcus landrumensis]|uniref:Arabinose transporter n=1 Tax=Myxococcus landrumensis TaxID=2813577 RepID=A0ABX7NE88_9BACT|nr:MFS transporter [Myxococcus landrumus]QSQ15706.1 arabinose transporter [Myxococcus landrumus]
MNESIAAPPVAAVRTPASQLLPLCAAVFLGFSSIGLPLPAIPGFVRGTLGFDALVVSIVLAVQSLATLATRHRSGTLADQRGPRRAVLLGLGLSALAGALYALVALSEATAALGLGLLLFARVVLGLGESLLITGALSWGIGLVGRERAGLVMAWNGIAMYSALALGAPVGAVLFERFGFLGVSLASMAAPLLAFAALPLLRPITPTGGKRLPFHRVAMMIGRPGVALSLSTLGFGSIAAFGTLLFQHRGWPHAERALLAFGVAYVLARLLFGHTPDKLGGRRVALGCLAIELCGQVLLWTATGPWMAITGAALTGFGFSLVFTSLGVEAVRLAPPENRGVAMGGYVAFFDVALGGLIPIIGVLVRAVGYPSAYLAGAVASATALVLTFGLARPPTAPR